MSRKRQVKIEKKKVDLNPDFQVNWRHYLPEVIDEDTVRIYEGDSGWMRSWGGRYAIETEKVCDDPVVFKSRISGKKWTKNEYHTAWFDGNDLKIRKSTPEDFKKCKIGIGTISECGIKGTLVGGRIIHETSRAILYEYNGQEIWFPRSHVEMTPNGLKIDEWICKKKRDEGYDL